MRRLLALAAALAAVFALAQPVAALPGNGDTGVTHAPVCAAVPVGRARCHADVVTGAGKPGKVQPVSYGATDLQRAYAVAGAIAAPTVAVVDAYDSPDVAAHLVTYRQVMGLPLCADGSVACLLTKYDQRGATGAAASYPAANTGWAQEIDLDVQMVSALCPACTIALVEADSNAFADLGAAVDTAATIPGVTAISNSYGGSEFSGEVAAASHYSHPGIAVTVSTGDSGYGVEFPASAPTVVAVGGTSLTFNGTAWSETAWSGAGSGCSAYIAKPAWQAGIATTCANRMVADVSADADPNTGVRVFTTGSSGTTWYVFGGTSVASPLVATVYALSGVPATSNDASAMYVPASAHLFDVTSGSNGRCTVGRSTTNAVLCTAGPGWDGPTGNGSPRGTFAL